MSSAADRRTRTWSPPPRWVRTCTPASGRAEGMATAAEVAALRADMLRFDQAEDTVVTFPRIVQAWGGLA